MVEDELANEPNPPNEPSQRPESVRVMISNPEEMGFQTTAQLGRDKQRGLFPHRRVLSLASSQANEATAFTFDEIPS
ncbi:uncharacterized [Tachysurus ichikawai]